MELSSFQLMGIETFHPQIAVITNILRHTWIIMVRGKNMFAKWAIQNMTADDTLILNWNQVELQTLAKTTAPTYCLFQQRLYSLSFRWKLYFNEEYIMPADELGIRQSQY